MHKKKKKGKKVSCFKRVFVVPLQSWFPNTVEYVRSLADQWCNIDAGLALPMPVSLCYINKVSPHFKFLGVCVLCTFTIVNFNRWSQILIQVFILQCK